MKAFSEIDLDNLDDEQIAYAWEQIAQSNFGKAIAVHLMRQVDALSIDANDPDADKALFQAGATTAYRFVINKLHGKRKFQTYRRKT